jgi:hypothetical protein
MHFPPSGLTQPGTSRYLACRGDDPYGTEGCGEED